MLLKKLRQENVVIGSGGISDVGTPSSSTSGGAVTAGVIGVNGLVLRVEASMAEDGVSGGGSSRCRFMTGGGAAPSEEEADISWGGSSGSSSSPTRECARQ